MKIETLIAMCEKRLVYLGQVRTSAEALGDIAQVESIDAQIAETTETLNLLYTLV